MDSHKTVNDILVNLFQEIMKIEERVLINDEFSDISVNDMHVIERVGLEGDKNMSTIAKELDITVGSLTTSMNGLVLKGYVLRERSEKDRRVVTIRLTEKGVNAYEHHAEFHRQMASLALQSLKEEEIPILVSTLYHLAEFFRNYK
ncbi:MAG: winged helix DNA-binding protein [Lachnospiraceae bacterium]|nr:winged helix DNA-binding protein [Lachnospiraceae bacterium]